jgi:PAS domain-containing protein
MNTIESLTVRTNAARGRLTELERRMENSTAAGPGVKPALKELSSALEELLVANEQLSLHVSELSATRHESAVLTARQDEFVNLLPLACIWTDERGTVEDANEATAALLNVATRRLSGKPLSLFLADRPSFLDAVSVLRSGASHVVDIAVQVRPRERRPRQMRVTGHKLRHDVRLCWILSDAPPAAPDSGAP